MGKYPVRTKIEISGKILKQLFTFEHLGCEISPTVDCDIENKRNTFKHICGTIYRTLKYKTRRETKLKC